MCSIACPRACVRDGLRPPQDEILTVIRRVDDNWAEGMLGDKIGIFPLLYVEVRSRSQTRIPFHPADCHQAGQGAGGRGGLLAWEPLFQEREMGTTLGFRSDCCAMRIVSAP